MGDAITVGIGFGSLGCCMLPESDRFKGVYILTNGHVIADAQGRINLGVKVYAGRAQNGSTLKKKVEGLPEIASVWRGVREFNHALGYVDWALCKVLNGLEVEVNNSVQGGSVTRFVDPGLTPVIKRGAATGLTRGNVEDTDFREQIEYLPSYPRQEDIDADQGLVRIQGQSFVMRGDSGSIAVSDSKAMALLFAGDQTIFSLGVPFRRVLQSVEAVTGTEWRIAPNGTYRGGQKLR